MPTIPQRMKIQSESWLTDQFEPELVSVIVPTYNRERWIGETLDSLHAQTWTPLEVIVVDDGSTDGTAKLLEKRSLRGDRMRVITQANAGVSAARNAGTQASRGEFIIYLDSDDLLFPEAIRNYVESLINGES